MGKPRAHNPLEFRRRVALILCAGAGFCGACFAQDARTNAMGGISILNEFSRVVYNPASINDFPDQIFGTSGSYQDTNGLDIKYFGPFLAKKSIGKNISIGFVANTVNENGSSVLRSKFYQNARLFLLSDSLSDLPTSFPMIPHLLLGLNVDPVSFGVEGFMEMSHIKKSIVNTERYFEKGIYNVGGKINANITIGQFWLCPLAGYGLPSIKGTSTDAPLYTFESINSSYSIMGSEFGIDLTPLTIVAGIYRTYEYYQFRNDVLLSPEYGMETWDLYTGFTSKILTDVVVACEYDLSIEHDKIIDSSPSSGIDFEGRYIYHAFHVGVEKPVLVQGMFDAITPRAGMAYKINDYTEQVRDTLTQYPLEANFAELSAGIGFKKSIFCLDLFVNIGNWNGVFTGPKAVSATLTIGLSKDFLKK